MFQRQRPRIALLGLTLFWTSACGDGGGKPIVDPDPPEATTLRITPASVSFDALDDTTRVSATVLDQYGDPMQNVSVGFVSEASGVATVDQFGLVKSVANGQTEVWGSVGQLRDTVTVTVAQTPKSVEIQAGSGQFHWTGFPLRDTLKIKVLDRIGTPVRGTPVTWQVVTGGGALLVLSPSTDSLGLSKALWLLGPGGTGVQQVSATVSTITPVLIQATGYAPVSVVDPEALEEVMLDTLDVTLLALDSLGVPEPGIPVGVVGLTGFGTVVQGPTTTGVNGRLVLRWVLGPSPGTQQLTLRRTDLNRQVVASAQGLGTVDPWPFSYVATGVSHTCALDSSGVAYCWGNGEDFQLGTGDQESATQPALVATALTWSEIGGGESYTCGRRGGGGGIYCWGDGFALGQGADLSSGAPLQVPGGPWTSFSAGGSHVCALAQGGGGFCWGSEVEGRLGNGVLASTGTPTAVSGGHAWTQVSAGRSHTCGITAAGDAFCWGRGAEGQLGYGGIEDRTAPVMVAGGFGWVEISAGWSHSCGVADTGDAFCWGEGSRNELGNGSSSDQTSPVKVAGNHSWSSVAAGRFHSCGIAADQKLYCWGQAGRVGLGTAGASAPTMVLPDEAWNAVVTQGTHTCAVTTDNRTFCFGTNSSGELGVRNTDDFNVPRLVFRSIIPPAGP